MTRYRGCMIFRVEEREKILARLDVRTTSPLNIYSSFENDRFREDKQITAYTRETPLKLKGTGYNMLIPELGEFKIVSFLCKQVNRGDLKKMYRYQLSLEG